MTLPIPLTRRAPEPPTPSGTEPALTSPGQGTSREFGAALASAIEHAPDGTAEGAKPQQVAPADVARDADATRPLLAIARDTSQRLTVSPDADRGEVAPGVPLLDAAALAHVPAGSEARVAGTATHDGAPGDDDAHPDDSARSDLFVATSLEDAMAPLPPLALVTTPPAAIPPALPSTLAAGDVVPPGTAPLPTARREPRPDAEARLAGIAAAMARTPHAVRKEVEALVPEMRQRLDRVIERMEQEFGYTVEVIETVRTQERQDALFAQGRTTPGPVVTWTRNSRHRDGFAADVVIDGGYTNAAGFERLARVAREEGLRTLWPRDPGHVELAPNVAATLSRGESRIGAETAPGGAGAAIAGAVGREGVGAKGERPTLHGASLPEAPPASTAPGGTPPLPRAARAAIDPAPSRPDVPHSLDRPGRTPLPAPGSDAQVLPFPRLGVPRLGEEGEGHGRLLREAAPFVPAVTEIAPGHAVAGVASSGVARQGAMAASTNVAQQASDNGRMAAVAAVASVATVAPVAAVSRVAAVARVARVAEPGSVGDARSDSGAPGAPPLTPAPVLAHDARGTQGGTSGERRSGGERGEGASNGDSEPHDVLPGVGALASRDDQGTSRLASTRELAGGDPAWRDAGDLGASSPVAGLSHSDATERIARVLRMQESGNDRPLSSVLLRLDHPDGGEDRIRIDLRGRSIGTTLDVADPRAAEQLRQHVGELQEALQRQGLEGESMIVRSAQRLTDATTLTASAVAAERDVLRAASASASDGGGSTAKDSRNHSHAPFDRDVGREGTDQQRSRQRRDGKGDTR